MAMRAATKGAALALTESVGVQHRVIAPRLRRHPLRQGGAGAQFHRHVRANVRTPRKGIFLLWCLLMYVPGEVVDCSHSMLHTVALRAAFLKLYLVFG